MTKNMKVEVSIEVFLNNVTSVDDNTSKSELYASYRLAWFIINIGSSDGYKKGQRTRLQLMRMGWSLIKLIGWRSPSQTYIKN